MIFYTVKTQKTKSRSNLQINWTEFGLIHPKFGEIVEVIKVLKKLKFNYANIRNLE
jgi:hypothetical protein